MLLSRLAKLVRWTTPGFACASTSAPTNTQHGAGPHRRVHARGGRSMEPSVAPGAKSALQQLFEEGLLQASHVQHDTPLPGPAVQRLAALMSGWLRCMHRLCIASMCTSAVDAPLTLHRAWLWLPHECPPCNALAHCRRRPSHGAWIPSKRIGSEYNIPLVPEEG